MPKSIGVHKFAGKRHTAELGPEWQGFQIAHEETESRGFARHPTSLGRPLSKKGKNEDGTVGDGRSD